MGGCGVGKRGGPLQYSDVAIETSLTLRLVFHLPVGLEFVIHSLVAGVERRLRTAAVWPTLSRV